MSGFEIFDPPSGLIIRTARNADAERVREFVFGILTEFGLEADLEETDSDLFDIEASYIHTGGTFELIEERNEKLVGTIGLYPINNVEIELRKMYFAPALRGRGLGRRLLERTIARARQLGYSTLYLETATVLEGAVRLYESCGFKPVAVVHSKRCDQGFKLALR
jgi:putative acetyltransferase